MPIMASSMRTASCIPSCSYSAPSAAAASRLRRRSVGRSSMELRPAPSASALAASHVANRRLVSPVCKASPGPAGASSAEQRLREADVIELNDFLQVWKARYQDRALPEGPGQVFLVGTGPGDPGLLTLRAAQLLQSADVVLYDRLVSDDILRLVNPGARMVYVGKEAGYHTRTQDEIHSLLQAFAEAGACVIRLKGGDPYVFGRGGEEVQYLQARGIKVHCVPGITAAAGICAELGLPMTHRGVATSARFLTGHSREGGEEMLAGQMEGMADEHTTLIVYMGLQTLPTLYRQLTECGMPPDMPAVAVERGTTAEQRVVFGRLSDLGPLTKKAALKSPTLLIIGRVVALAPGWQEWQEGGMPLEWDWQKDRAEYQHYSSPESLLGDPALMRAVSGLPSRRVPSSSEPRQPSAV